MSEPINDGDMDAGGTHRTISFLNRWAPPRLQRCSYLLLDEKHDCDLTGCQPRVWKLLEVVQHLVLEVCITHCCVRPRLAQEDTTIQIAAPHVS